jgi:hypothetical protein
MSVVQALAAGAERGETQAQGQPGLHSKTPSQKQTNDNNNNNKKLSTEALTTKGNGV